MAWLTGQIQVETSFSRAPPGPPTPGGPGPEGAAVKAMRQLLLKMDEV